MTFTLGDLVNILVPFLGLVILGIWYHISIMNKVVTLELKIASLVEKINYLEEALSENISDLGEKLDSFVYELALKRNDKIAKKPKKPIRLPARKRESHGPL